MGDFRALTIQGGTTTRQQDADNLIVGAAVKTAAGNLSLIAASGIIGLASQNLTGTGSSAIDFSGSTGAFSTPTGATTFGGSSNTFTNAISADGGIDTSSAVPLSIGATNATTVNVGRTGQLVQVQGNLQVQGIETVVGTSEFQQDASFIGNVTFGDSTTDRVSFLSRIGTPGSPNFIFAQGLAPVIKVEDTTSTRGNGPILTITNSKGGPSGGVGTAGRGGALFIVGATGGDGDATHLAGKGGQITIHGGFGGTDNGGGGNLGGGVDLDAGAGTGATPANGSVLVGTSTADIVTIGRTTKETNVQGFLTVNEGFTVSGGGAVDIQGNADSTFSTTAGKITINAFAGLDLISNSVTALSINTAGNAITIGAGVTLGTDTTGNINLPNNASARFQIEGSAVGATVTATNLNTLSDGSNADALHTHTALPALNFKLVGLTTTALTGGSGQAGYVSANNTVTPTDNAVLAKSRFFGFSDGVAGEIIPNGQVGDAQFTTAGGSPSAGSPVYLAAAADDTATGAGKLTATPPSSGVIAEVGIVLDNANYASAKTCKILVQVKAPVSL